MELKKVHFMHGDEIELPPRGTTDKPVFSVFCTMDIGEGEAPLIAGFSFLGLESLANRDGSRVNVQDMHDIYRHLMQIMDETLPEIFAGKNFFRFHRPEGGE